MGFKIPSTTPRPTDKELENPQLLHSYFEKNFAETPELKGELEAVTSGVSFDSYESFSELLADEGIACPSAWTGRAGGSGIHGSSQAFTKQFTSVKNAPLENDADTLDPHYRDELLDFDPFESHDQTDRDLAIIFDDPQLFSDWVHHQGIESAFENNYLLDHTAPSSVTEFYETLFLKFTSDGFALEEIPEFPSTPFATPQSALTGLKTKLTTHFENTYKGLGQLLEPCEKDGFVMLNVPNIVAGGFGIFTQAMIQGKQNAIAGLKNILGNYAGMTGSERDSSAEALFYFYERVFTTALGSNFRNSAEFQSYAAEYKADGHGSVNVLGIDPFSNIESATYKFTYSFFQKHHDAFAELEKIENSATYDLITSQISDEQIHIQRALSEIASIKSPDRLYDLIHNYANYGQARKYIYDYLGITEAMVSQAQTQLDPEQKPSAMDDHTWDLVKCLAQRKNDIEFEDSAFMVLSIGGSILAGIAAGATAGVLSGGNPIVAGYAATATAMTTAAAIGTKQVIDAYDELEWAQASRAVSVFENIPLGSDQMVTFLDEKVKYTMVAAGGNVILAGLGAGSGTMITQALEGQLLKRIAVQSLYGSLDGTLSVAIDGNTNNQERLNQTTVLAGGTVEDAPTVTEVFFTAAVLGGTIGGVGEAVFNPGEVKIAMNLATGRLSFFDGSGNPIKVKACVKVQEGVYKVTNDKGEVAHFKVDEKNVGVVIPKTPVPAKTSAPTQPKPKNDSTTATKDSSATPTRRQATPEDVQAYLSAHPELKSENIPDDVLEAAVLRYLNNPEQEFAIGSFNTGHEFQEGADAAHAATTPLGNDDGYSAAEADFFGYESSAHFHGGKMSLDERMLRTAGQEFDEDLQFLAARARVHHEYNLNNADNPAAHELPTTLTHEIFGVGADGKLAKLKITASYDPERDAVRFAIDGVNVSEGTVKAVRARGLEVDNEVRAMPSEDVERMAGQEAASVYDKKLPKQLQPLAPMPSGLRQELENLQPGETVTIGRDAPLDGMDLNRTIEVNPGVMGCPVSRQHLKIRKNTDGTFTLIDISSAGTLIKKADGTVYQVFVAADPITQSPAHFIRNLKTNDITKGNEIPLGAGDEVIFPNGERFAFDPPVVRLKIREDVIPTVPKQKFEDDLLSLVDDPRSSMAVGQISHASIDEGLDHPSVQIRHAYIKFEDGRYRMTTLEGAPVLVKRGNEVLDATTTPDGVFVLQPGDIIQLGDAPPFVFEYPFNSTQRYLTQNKLAMTGTVVLTRPKVQDIIDYCDEALLMLRHGQTRGDQRPMVVQILIDPDLAKDAFQLPILIGQCRTILSQRYPQIFGFEIVPFRAGGSPEPLHFEINPNYGAKPLPSVAPVPRRPAPPAEPPPTQWVRVGPAPKAPAPDHITGRLNVGDEVYVPREQGQVAQRGWRITAVDTDAQTVTVEREFPNPNGGSVLMKKTIPAKDVAPPRAVEANMTRIGDFVPEGDGFRHVRSSKIYLRRYGIMDEATYTRLFQGDFAQQDVGNCYLVSAFNNIRVDRDNFEVWMRTSMGVPGGKALNPDGSISDRILEPGHYQVRVPFGQLKGEVVDVYENELRSQWNRKFLSTDKEGKRDRRVTLSPLKGPKGFQILEAVYIKLANQGVLDRSAVEGGFSAEALKKMFGDNVHRRMYGSYTSATKPFSDPVNISLRQQVHDYFLKFNSQRDICSVASRPNPRKGGHSGSYKVGKFRIYMSHSYSVESVTYGAGATPSTKTITSITVVNPWDTSKKMVMTEEEFMEAFAMIDAVRIDMGKMFDEARPVSP